MAKRCVQSTSLTRTQAGPNRARRPAYVERAAEYACDRVVFNRPIGQNQGIVHPFTEAYVKLGGAKLATYHPARLYDESGSEGPKSDVTPASVAVACNSAKYMAAEAAFNACESAVLTHGGMGYAAEYDVERWLRECLVPRIVPVSRKKILTYIGEKALGVPRSYYRANPKT